jgi:hypothetical protein
MLGIEGFLFSRVSRSISGAAYLSISWVEVIVGVLQQEGEELTNQYGTKEGQNKPR